MIEQDEPQALLDLRRWLTSIGSLTAAVTSGRRLQDVLELVAETALELLAADFCAVLVPDAGRKTLVIKGWSGLTAEYVTRVNSDMPIRIDSPQARGGSPSSRAFRSGKPVSIADIDAERGFSWVGFAREQGYRALLSVPFGSGSDVLGTLNIYRRSPHQFGAFEVERVQLLADHAAIALTSARVVADLRHQHDLITRSEWIHDRLLGLALREGGVDGITRAVAELLTADVLLEAAHGEVLASVTGRGSMVSPETRGSFSSAADDPANVVHAYEGQSIVNVVLGNAVTARLWVGRDIGSLGALDRRALEHAAVVLSLEFLRQRTAAEVEQRLRGELLGDILQGADVRSEPLLTRAHLLGHDLTRPHIAVVAEAHSRDHKPLGPHAVERVVVDVSRLASAYTPRPLVAIHAEKLVIFWPTGATADDLSSATADDPREIGNLVRRTMKAAPGVGTVAVAVALPSQGSIRATYRTAVGALSISTADQQPDRTVTLEDLGVMGLLLQLEDTGQLVAFADRTLGALRTHDAARGTELLHTLRVYVEVGLDRQAAADELLVHPNTVSQRLRRAEVVGSLSLGDSKTMVDIKTALMVLDVAQAMDSSAGRA